MSNEEIGIVGLSTKKVRGKSNIKIILAVIGIVVLALGIVAGIILVREQQNISENAQITCDEQCPGADGVLRNCHPPAADGSAQESICSSGGLVKFCGTRNYCCPSVGAPWTTNMTLCATPEPTVSGSPTATATSTASTSGSPTATATSTASTSGSPTAKATSTASGRASTTPTASSSGTAVPIPVTGASWPTILGMGIGIIVILASLVLAL